MVNMFVRSLVSNWPNNLNILRISIHSQEHPMEPGRKMSSYVGFENENVQTSGIISFRSSHTLKSEMIWLVGQLTNGLQRTENIGQYECVLSYSTFYIDRLGGKFISLIAEKMIENWELHCKTKIVPTMTTSLHGSQSQYNGMKWWNILELLRNTPKTIERWMVILENLLMENTERFMTKRTTRHRPPKECWVLFSSS